MPSSEAMIVSNEHERTIQKLKVKINKQVDKIEELQNEVKKKDEMLEQLRSDSSKIESTDDNELLIVIKNLCYITQRLVRDNQFIQYKNFTKNSIRYSKVEKIVFDTYVDNFVSMDKKLFLSRCVEIGFLKSNDEGRYTFNDNQIRIYFINKAMVNLVSGEKIC